MASGILYKTIRFVVVMLCFRPLRLFLITCPSQELLDFGDMQASERTVKCSATRWGAGAWGGAALIPQVQERQSFTLKLSSPTFERDHAAAAEAADEQVAVSCLVSNCWAK